MIVDQKTLFSLLEQTDIHPSKDYGQNFLINPEIARRMFSILDLNKDDYVLEIGSGVGSITHYFTTVGNEIDAVDIDSHLTHVLKVIYKEDHHIHIINSDIRKRDLSSYTKIISSLPYNLTTELVTNILLFGSNLIRAVLMCESETLNRFLSLRGKNYGPTSVLIHLLASIHKEFHVSRNHFYPVPKCESSVFTIDINHSVEREKAIATYELSKAMFLNRRKTILNNLKWYLNSDTLAIQVLKETNIELTRRPEQISPSEYLALFERIKAYEDISGQKL